MQGYNFTERVRQVLAQARHEAVEMGHEYVGCEHLLLGILSSDGIGGVVLQNLGLEPLRVETVLKQTLKRGKGDVRENAHDLPYTSRAKKTLELAMDEARALNHAYVGTEHLLMGLLREEKSIAAQVLYSLGVTVDDARAEMLRIVGLEPEKRKLVAPTGEVPVRVNLSLHYANGAVITKSFNDTAEAARFLSAP